LAYNNAIGAYRQSKIKTAGQSKLIIMLYDEAVKSLDNALELMDVYSKAEKRDPALIERIGKALVRCEDMVSELSASLDFEKGKDIAKNLFALYNWFIEQLIDANVTLDAKRTRTVRDQIARLRTAWIQAASTTAQTPAAPPQGLNIAC
jgi:flagellar protein FliS